MKFKKLISGFYETLLSKESKRRFEKFIFVAAVIGLLIHLALIGLLQLGQLSNIGVLRGFQNPVDALYTPFSLILFYEVYCLIYYLPKSITIYIGKQYEIMALITVREMFNELSYLQLSSNTHELKNQPRFLYSMAAILLLFAVIYLYYRMNQRAVKVDNRTNEHDKNLPPKVQHYISAKRALALCVGILFIVFMIVFVHKWVIGSDNLVDLFENSKAVSNMFFSSFFTILILADVVILLFSFAMNDEFHIVMRNSGFVISTTLLKMSFGVEGLVNHIIMLSGVVFGTLMLLVFKFYEKIEIPEE